MEIQPSKNATRSNYFSTVKPRYLATFGPAHNYGERRGWRLNGVAQE